MNTRLQITLKLTVGGGEVRFAIDYDTTVATDPPVWTKATREFIKQGNIIVIIVSPHNATEADEWAYHVGAREVFVLGSTKQHQDILSADIWITGRPDRVLGKEQVQVLHDKYAKLSNPDDFH